MPIKTAKKNPGARMPKAPTTDWMKIARQHNLKLELALTDNNGDIVESIPVAWNRVPELDVNMRPIERYVTTTYTETGTEKPTGRQVA
jgi:hypothetical protein